MADCPTCEGKRYVKEMGKTACSSCSGLGFSYCPPIVYCYCGGSHASYTCNSCGGSGQRRCYKCNGSGQIQCSCGGGYVSCVIQKKCPDCWELQPGQNPGWSSIMWEKDRAKFIGEQEAYLWYLFYNKFDEFESIDILSRYAYLQEISDYRYLRVPSQFMTERVAREYKRILEYQKQRREREEQEEKQRKEAEEHAIRLREWREDGYIEWVEALYDNRLSYKTIEAKPAVYNTACCYQTKKEYFRCVGYCCCDPNYFTDEYVFYKLRDEYDVKAFCDCDNLYNCSDLCVSRFCCCYLCGQRGSANHEDSTRKRLQTMFKHEQERRRLVESQIMKT